MMCSARSLALSAIAPPPSAGRVPLIGIVSTRRPCVRRNSSGEADTTDHPSPCMSIAHAPATGASSGNTPRGSPENGAFMCCTRLTW